MSINKTEEQRLGSLDDVLEKLGTIWDDIVDSLLLGPKTLDEMAEIYADATDIYIINNQSDELRFVGGEFKLSLASAQQVQALGELYFKNQSKEWIKKELKSEIKVTHLTDCALGELQQVKTKIYKITPPQKDAH